MSERDVFELWRRYWYLLNTDAPQHASLEHQEIVAALLALVDVVSGAVEELARRFGEDPQ